MRIARTRALTNRCLVRFERVRSEWNGLALDEGTFPPWNSDASSNTAAYVVNNQRRTFLRRLVLLLFERRKLSSNAIARIARATRVHRGILLSRGVFGDSRVAKRSRFTTEAASNLSTLRHVSLSEFKAECGFRPAKGELTFSANDVWYMRSRVYSG